MLTSSGRYGDAQRCRDLNISAYLCKPIKQADLRVAIGEILRPGRLSAPASIAEPSAPRRLKVLLAEDNPVNQRVAAALLTKRGHHVTIVANGIQALVAIDGEPFDVVLMDIQMPEMGGVEATAAIRAREQERGGHLRIIALTAHTMSGDRERYLAAGMDGYLAKPIDRLALFAAVEDERAAAATPAAPPFNRALLIERLGGDEALVRDVVQLFLTDSPPRIAAIRVAIENGDTRALESAAHALKGALTNLAADEALEAIKSLEELARDGHMNEARGAWKTAKAALDALLAALREDYRIPGAVAEP
jgi:CheY-like chemotaxis protein